MSNVTTQVTERCLQLSKMIEKMSEDLSNAQSEFNKSKQEFHIDGTKTMQQMNKQDNIYTKKLDQVKEPLSLIFKFKKLDGLSSETLWYISLYYGDNIIQTNQCKGPEINEKLKVQIDPPDKATMIKVEIWKIGNEQIMYDQSEIELCNFLQQFKNNDKLSNYNLILKKHKNIAFTMDATMHGVGVKVWLDAHNRFINGISYQSQQPSLIETNNDYLINSFDEKSEKQKQQENKLLETKKNDEEQRQVTALKFIRQTNQLLQELEEIEQQNQQEAKQALLKQQQQQMIQQQQQQQLEQQNQQQQQQISSAPKQEDSQQNQNQFKATEITQGNDQYENSFLDESTVKLLEEVQIKKGQQQQQQNQQPFQDQQRKQISQGSLQLQNSFNNNEQPLKIHEQTEEEKEREQRKLQEFKKWEEKLKEEEKQKEQKQKKLQQEKEKQLTSRKPSSIQLSINKISNITSIKSNIYLEFYIKFKSEQLYKHEADNHFMKLDQNNKHVMINQDIQVPFDYQKVKNEKQQDLENYYLIFNIFTKDQKSQQNVTVGWLAFPLFKNKKLNIGILDLNVFKPPIQNREIQDLKQANQLQMQEKIEFQLKKNKSSDEEENEMHLIDQSDKDLLRSQVKKQQQFEQQDVYFISLNISRLLKANYQQQLKKQIEEDDLELGIELAVKKKNLLLFQRLVNDDLFMNPDDYGTIVYDYTINLPIDHRKIKSENSAELDEYNIIIEIIQRKEKKKQSSFAWLSIPLFNTNGKLNSGKFAMNLLKPPVLNRAPLDQKQLSKLEIESKLEMYIESIKQETEDQQQISAAEQQKQDALREQKKKQKDLIENTSLNLNVVSLQNIKSIQSEIRVEISIKKNNELIYRKILNEKFQQIEKKQTYINFNINLQIPFDYNSITAKEGPEDLQEYYILFEFITRREMMQSSFGWFSIPIFASNSKLNLGSFSEKLIKSPVQINQLKKTELSEFLEFQLSKTDLKSQDSQKK